VLGGAPDHQGKKRFDQKLHLPICDSPGGSTDQRFRLLRNYFRLDLLALQLSASWVIDDDDADDDDDDDDPDDADDADDDDGKWMFQRRDTRGMQHHYLIVGLVSISNYPYYDKVVCNSS